MDSLVHNDFVIPIPPGWTDTTLIVLSGVQKGELTPTLTLLARDIPRPMTAAEFAAAQRDGFPQTLGPAGFEFVEEGIFHGINYDAYRFVYHFALHEGHPRATQIQVYVVRKQKVYMITGTDLESDFPQSRPIFESAIRGFRIRDE